MMARGVWVCSLLSLGLYLNSLPAEFAYDDSRAIQKNPDLLPETPLSQLFYDDFWGTPLTHSGSHKSYRPLTVLTFRLNYFLGALNPFGYHLGNVLLHAAVTAVYTYVARLLLHRRTPAVVAGLLFASHPIHAEAVAGVVGRADVLACLFFLLAFLAYMRYCKFRDKPQIIQLRSSSSASSQSNYNSNSSTQNHHRARGGSSHHHHHHNNSSSSSHQEISGWRRGQRWLYLAACAALTAAAMLSKEQGVTVLAVCATYDVFLRHRVSLKGIRHIFQVRYQSLWEGLLALSAMGVGFIGFRIYFMGNKPPEFAPADNPASDSESLLTRSLTFTYLPFLNFWILLFPNILSFDWSMDSVPLLETLTDPRNLCTITFYGILAYVGVYMARHLNHVPGDHGGSGGGASAHNGNGNGYAAHAHSHSPGSATSPTTSSHSSGGGGGSSSSSSSYTSSFSSPGGGPSSSRGWPRRRGGHFRRGSTSSTGSDDDAAGGSSWSLKSGNSIVHLTADQRQHQRTLHVLVVALAMMIFPFIPAANIFFYVGFVIAERVLYIPSMGFCLLVAHGAGVMYDKYWRDVVRRQLIVVAVGCIVCLYGARTVLRNQDWLSEENLYKSGVHVNPAKAWGNLANILNTQGKIGEAEEAYRAALRHRGNMADVHYNLGILLQERKRYTEAIDSYQMAIQCRPRLTMAYLNLGIVFGILNRKEEAEKMYRHCAEIDISGLKDPRLHENTKISALYNLGRLLADQDKYQGAIEMYKEAIRRRPNHYAPQSLYNMLGEAYSKLGDLDEAEKWYEEALRSKPDHIPAHLTMAKLLHRRGKREEAEHWFKKAMELDYTDGSVYQHYAQFLGEIGRHNEAAEYYVKAVTQTPDDFELIFNTANGLRQAQRNQEAESFYRKAAKLRPNMATAHMNLGAMLHFNGKLAEAEQSYKMALRLKPDDHVTQANLKKLQNLMKKATSSNNSNNNNNSNGNSRR